MQCDPLHAFFQEKNSNIESRMISEELNTRKNQHQSAMAKLKILGLIAVFAAMTGCTSDSGDIRMNEINGSWDKKAEQKFDLQISDFQNPKNIIFVVRIYKQIL